VAEVEEGAEAEEEEEEEEENVAVEDAVFPLPPRDLLHVEDTCARSST
jgi:hypothetical protein